MNIARIGRALARWLTEPARTILQQRLWRPMEKGLFAQTFRRVNALDMKWPIEVTFEGAELRVRDGPRSLVIARQERVPLYRHGIDHRFDRLTLEYLLGDVPVRPGDLIVDVGANIGEVGLLLACRNGARVVAIEPEAEEFSCLQQNLAGVAATCINSALWSSETDLKFYSKNETGDSSVFEITDYSAVRTVHATTLKAVLDRHGADRVRLLKLEAEGAEPEVLQGAGDWLQRIDYVTADVGPERGLSQESTAVQVIAHMQEAGFELVKVSAPRLVCLFRNRQVPVG